MESQIRIAGIVDDSIVDGPGLRLTVFAQGCPHGCPGCHNPHTHDPEGGFLVGFEEILGKIDKNPLLDGVTFSGGEPFLQHRQFAALARSIKARRSMSVMVYSGYTWERILSEYDKYKDFLDVIDVLVDGPFMAGKKSYKLTYKGSENQRIIDVAASLKNGEITSLEF